MAKSSGPPPIVYILIFLILLGTGYWFFLKKPADDPGNINSNTQLTDPPPPPDAEIFPSPASVPPNTQVRIDGSTSMVTINQNLKQGFERQFPGVQVETAANGTNNGIQAVLNGEVDIAGVSRSLTPQEEKQGLKALPIASDQIAIVVGVNNPYQGGLTDSQVYGIFTGQITNWSEVGGPNATIQVINRPAVSGTHQAFQEMILQGRTFGTTPNITTLPRDETTGMLRQLGEDGIGYATFTQVVNQQTVRTVPVEGVQPGSVSYPYQRQLYYVYKQPATPAVQAILGYATSPEGQQVIFREN
ncbi:phosphate ABC transporter substrate-binding protein [Limnoraphis robusta]|uniref:Phosphate ABC transporter substrate-binding protein n=1 Tax=Limnoraphis robusta CCNP1315 TaxID=3110306 RepID=A0ABU5TXX0_9CYAN|nr:phosphate ABC transporter substrate-binding protein [Limnoraphis robusta]MEA5519773.1 phosphate ABC transporter substrate-binding protein [Limnoraphis robusta CCNP1315]MEA5547527.1 phosphate ABC transporter substrate-binding protein [Limnoraphis robusta CCNP1324]